jgi:hypothetical protein
MNENYTLWCNTMNFIKNKYNKNIFNKFSKDSDYVAIIIEPRCHIHFESVLKNFASKLDNKWSLIIFHGNLNKKFIENIIGNNNNIKLVNLNVDNLTIYEYSDILLDINFWNNINSENILVFQTDCLLRKNIDNFLKYDYIGAPWKKKNKCIKITNSLVGNGGLSFRKKSAILKILKLVDYKFKSNSSISEDIFYSMWMKKFNMNLPSSDKAELFSSEHICNYECAGLHKTYHYLTKKELKKLIDFSYF